YFPGFLVACNTFYQITKGLAFDQQVVAKNHLHVFSIDLQPLDAAVFGDDVAFRFFRVMDRSKSGEDTLRCDHSQNVKTLDHRAGVSHKSLVAPALPGNMRVSGLEADEILKMEILAVRHRDSTDAGKRGRGQIGRASCRERGEIAGGRAG